MALSKYTPALAVEICARLATGETLRSICRDDHMPTESSVREWVVTDREGFAAHYARARDFGLDSLSDEIILIADTPVNGVKTIEDDKGTRFITGDMIEHRRLQVDTRKWYLSKLAPKRYGDKITQEVTGADGTPLFGDEERARRLAALRYRIEQNKLSEPADASDLA